MYRRHFDVWSELDVAVGMVSLVLKVTTTTEMTVNYDNDDDDDDDDNDDDDDDSVASEVPKLLGREPGVESR